MGAALALKAPAGNLVDVDEVIVGADGEPQVVGGEGHNLDPLGGVAEKVALGVGVSAAPDGDSTVVTGDRHPVVVSSNSARAL